MRKVHVWLAESEEELERLCLEERKVGETPDISAVTKIFQEHESFMSSLSESQVLLHYINIRFLYQQYVIKGRNRWDSA